MTKFHIPRVAPRRFALFALLIAICTTTWAQLIEENEAAGSHPDNTNDSGSLADALDPPAPPKYKTQTSLTPRPQVRPPGLKARQTGVSTKAPAIHIANPINPGSQFDLAQKALLQGSTASASDAYERILKDDPRNTDALLGLALIHLRKGNNSTAEALIYKTLAISPRDSLALALLSPLRATGNTAQEESRLLHALADQPDAAPLHFALGNLYAQQNRWREAQQAYFKATIGDRDHPDYLFNLAVSLDRIKQPQAAKQYYQAALAAAALRPAAFSRTLASNRVDNMDRSLP